MEIKGVFLFEFKYEDTSNWFVDGIIKKVDSGFERLFWTNPRIGSISLKDRYLRLFTINDYFEKSVGEVGRWIDEILIWDLGGGG